MEAFQPPVTKRGRSGGKVQSSQEVSKKEVLSKGKKGKGNSIQTSDGDYDPDEFSTMSRGIAKCPNCNNLIQTEYIYESARQDAIGHQLYAVAFKQGKSGLDFRSVQLKDLEGIQLAEIKIKDLLSDSNYFGLIPIEEIPIGKKKDEKLLFLT